MTIRSWIRNVFAAKPCALHKAPARFRPTLEALEDRFAPAVITVTTAINSALANDGSVSLREAIRSINDGTDLGDSDIAAQAPGVFGINDTINFNIPGAGVHTITLSSISNLDAIAKTMTIDGYSQPGARPNTLATGNNAIILIEINASGNEGVTVGEIEFITDNIFQENGRGSTIRGLSIFNSSSNGIRLIVSDNVIAGNYIGLRADGVTVVPNVENGVQIEKLQSTGTAQTSTNNLIGGPTPADRNVISGNLKNGVQIHGGHDLHSDYLDFRYGYFNKVQGNFIGTDASGTLPAGNGENGVGLGGVSKCLVGGVTSGEANTIAFNGGAGVQSGPGVNNAIRGNSIFANGGLGIDLTWYAFEPFRLVGYGVTPNDAGDTDIVHGRGNPVQNFPVLASSSSGNGVTTITGVINSNANVALIIDFYATAASDSSGFGEGQICLGATGVVTDGAGNATFSASFTASLPAGQFITATATTIANAPYGDTSEFSHSIQVNQLPVEQPPVNQPPMIANQTFTLNENGLADTLVGTVAASETDAGQTLTYAILTGNSGGAFFLNPGTGLITVNSSAALNYETSPSFSLIVQVTDNGSPSRSSTATIFIDLNNVNEAPVIGNQTFSLNEKSLNGTVVGTTAASDPDAGQSLTYAILNGNTGGAFFINPGTGLITVNNSAALDYETTPSFSLTVQVTDTGLPSQSSTATVAINLNNVNETPVIDNQTFSLNENSLNATAVGTATASDPDAGQTLTYAILNGNTGGAFFINPGTGLITVNNSADLNYESTPSFSLIVQVTDNGSPSQSSTATVAVNLNNVNEAPVNTVPGGQSLALGSTLTFFSANGNAMSIADVDAGQSLLRVTLSVSHGNLTLGTLSGLIFTTGDGVKDATMTFTGTLSAINTALQGLKYIPDRGFVGSDTLAITTNDLGNTGLGSALSDTDFVTIIVKKKK